MKIIHKLTLGHLIVSLLVIVVAVFGIGTINKISTAHNELAEQTLPVIEALGDVRAAGMRIVVSTSELVLIRAEGKLNATALEEVEKEHVESGKIQYEAAISRYEEHVNKFFPEERGFLENIKNRGKKLQKTSDELMALKERGVSGTIVMEKWGEFEAAEQEFLKAVDDAIAYEDKEIAQRKQNAGYAIAEALRTMLITGLLTFAIAIILGVNISSSISRPVLKLKNAAVEFGKGKLDTRVDINSKDEVGVLAACFNEMAGRIEGDIEERRKAEEALQALTLRQEAILSAVPDIIMEVDANRIYTWANKAGYEFFGDDVIGKEAAFYFEGEQETYNKVQPLFAGSEDVIYVESLQRRKDGAKRLLGWWCRVLKDAKGNVAGALSTARDITESKRLEELRLENVRLMYADRAKSEFLARMSHELRTPLNAIMGFSELMKQKTTGELNEKQEHYLDNIYEGGKNLLNIISEILDLVQMESGKIELTIETFPVPEVIGECMNLLKNKAVQRNVTIKKQISPRLELIEADKRRFRQVLLNLLDNAVKFSKPEGGTVTITAEKVGDTAQFSVSDTGIGIREENVGKLFNTFWQLDSGIARNHEGLGIGLAISKQLVELHRGKIWVESKYGEGSTFTFVLPLKAMKEKNEKSARG